MPRKVVYGKKTSKSSAFSIANDFFSGSPAKLSRPRTAASSTGHHGTIEEATIALERLEIRHISENGENGENDELEKCDIGIVRAEPKTAKMREAFGARDPNSKVPTKTREIIQRQLKSTKDNAKTDTGREVSISQDVQNSEWAPPIPRIYTNAPHPTCDPYIAPLVALTNKHSQSFPAAFETWSAEISQHFRVSKIAEATYSEVYRLSLLAPRANLTSDQESVFKIIALKPNPDDENSRKKKSGAQLKREANMSHVKSVESEVKLLKRMTDFPGFTNYRALHILKGRPSQPFIDAWKEWNDGRKSEFSDPSKKASYGTDQLWAVIEMQDAGTDVEDLHKRKRLNTVCEVWDIFWQVAIALGKGEANANFEHRDLHCGNICVRERRKPKMEPTPHVRKEEKKLHFTNLETTIIDYTLSRAEIPSTDPSENKYPSPSSSPTSRPSSFPRKEQNLEVIYLDLANPSEEALFNGTVYNAEDYQYDIYRYMRSAIYFTSPQHVYTGNEQVVKASERTWEGYHPQTNLVWLHYVLHQLCRGLDEGVEMDRLAWKLKGFLGIVKGLLRLEGLPREGFACVGDLVAVALEEGWLDEVDVKGI